MVSSVLKLDGRSARGRSWKKLSGCGKPVNQGALVNNTICSHCNATPDANKNTVIKCMGCNLAFHTTCLLMPITENAVKCIAENPSMWWFCLNCISVKSGDSQTFPHSSEGAVSTPTDVLLQNNLSSFKKEMLLLIGETIDRKFQESNNAKRPSSEQPQNAWKDGDSSKLFQSGNSNVLEVNTGSDPPLRKTAPKHILLLDPKSKKGNTKSDGTGTNKTTMRNVSNAINDINVDFCNVNQSGVVALGFKDAAEKKKAQDKIQECSDISNAYTLKSPKKLLPVVTLHGINEVLFDLCLDDRDNMKATLRDDILLRNDGLQNLLDSGEDETLDVVMIQKHMPTNSSVEYSAAVRMSPAIRKLVHDNGNKLYVSLSRCRVTNRYQALQCYHCQKIGHHSDSCPDKNEAPTCMHCSERHATKDCTQKNKKCCSNCLKSKNDAHKRNAHTHHAASRECPYIKSSQGRLKNRTEQWLGKK